MSFWKVTFRFEVILRYCRYLIGDKKVGKKWQSFLQVTKFFPDFLFPDQYFSPIFFHLTKNLSRFFFQLLLLLLLILSLLLLLLGSYSYSLIVIVVENYLVQKLFVLYSHEGVYLQHPIPWISDTNRALLRAQFEKFQTKRTTFLWKKSSPLMKVLLILKIGRGKVTNLKN